MPRRRRPEPRDDDDAPRRRRRPLHFEKYTPEDLERDLEASLKELAAGEQPISPDGVCPAPVNVALAWGEVERARKLIAELAARRMEGLRLYEPLPIANLFHADRRLERLVRGSNRAGKTLAAAAEVSRAATGQDPFNKFPLRDGRAFCVAKDGKLLGQVMWRKLGRTGAFHIVRDLATGLWRAFRPHQDKGREKERRPAPPLIPARMIAEIAWESKKEMIPSVVRLVNGWELSFFSSLGHPPTGTDIDLGWFDEEIVIAEWYGEVSARLLDRNGTFLWSATPQAATEQLFDLHLRAEAEPAAVGEHIMLLDDNPHVSDEAKIAFAAKLTPEERRIRVAGEFALSGFKIFPEFSLPVHGARLPAVPLEWTRYLAVDPGRQTCAVLFVAIPPCDEQLPPPRVWAYDELYIHQCDAHKFGEQMASKCQGQDFEAFFIDNQAGRITEMGSGLNVEAQYSAALKAKGIKSRLTGHGFRWGTTDSDARILKVRDWLRVDPKGDTVLKIRIGDDGGSMLPNLKREFEHYHYARNGVLVTDKPVKKNDHLMDDVGYLAAGELRYRKVKPKPKGNYATAAMQAKFAKRKQAEGRDTRAFVRMGPGRG